MSTLQRGEYHSDEALRYAPRWLREERMARPQPLRRPEPIDDWRELDTVEPLFDRHDFAGDQFAPAISDDELEFEGDIAIRQMREAHAFEPDPIPMPEWHPRPQFPLGMIVRSALAVAVAAVAALVYVGVVPVPSFAVARNMAAFLDGTLATTRSPNDASAPPASTAVALTAGVAANEAAAVETSGANASPENVAQPVKPVAVASVVPWPAVATAAEPPAAASAAVVRRLETSEIDDLVRRGDAFILQGDFASARLMLQRAAEAGSARAAVTLGATYDPVMLGKVGAVGFAAAPARAREWYERAIALGSTEALARLEELKRN